MDKGNNEKIGDAIASLKKVQDIYREIYGAYDPEGEIAVHIEYDNAIDQVIQTILDVTGYELECTFCGRQLTLDGPLTVNSLRYVSEDGDFYCHDCLVKGE